MKKYNLFYWVLLACMFFTSCGSSDVEMTGKGMLGDFPQFLLKYCDLSKQCADELEFEDNASKQGEIVNKYQEQWAKYVEGSGFVENLLKSSNREIPVVAPEEYGLSSAYLQVKDFDISLNHKDNTPKVKLEMKYSGKKPSAIFCFFLNDKDSVVFFGTLLSDYNNHSEINMTFPLNIKKNKDRDIMKFSLYALDKAVKIKVVDGKESLGLLESFKRNSQELVRSLSEAGIVELSSFDDFLDAKEQAKDEAKAEEKQEEVDKNKPGLVDLAYFELRGPVKSFTEFCDGTRTFTYQFTENGKWESRDAKKLSAFCTDVKRDSEKRIIGYQIEENYAYYTYTISYDAKTGWVSKIVCDGSDENKTTTFSYDENGYVTKEVEDGSYTEEGADEPTKEHIVTNYKYESFDKYGNWTKRSIKRSDSGTWVEKRYISYY